MVLCLLLVFFFVVLSRVADGGRVVHLRHTAVHLHDVALDSIRVRRAGVVQYWVTVDPSVLSSDAAIEGHTNCSAIPHKLHGHTFQCLSDRGDALQRVDGVVRVRRVLPAEKFDPAAMRHAEGGVTALLLPSKRVDAVRVLSRWNRTLPYSFRRVGEWAIRVLDPTVHKRGHFKLRPSVRGRMPSAVVKRLSTDEAVYWIEPFAAPRLSNAFAVPFVMNSQAATLGEGGTHEIITIADTGLDYHHCEFDAHHVPKSRLTIEVGVLPPRPLIHLSSKVPAYISYDFQDGGDHVQTDFEDVDSGHGTHVVGTAAGKYGAAPQARILFLDLGFKEAGVEYLYTPHDLHLHFFEHIKTYTPSRIFSISWGTDINEYTDNARMIDAFVASNPEFVIVIAAGNQGNDGVGTVGSPATAKNAISVGASCSTKSAYDEYRSQPFLWVENGGSFPFSDTSALHSGAVAAFSSAGPTRDGRLKPDVLAPGTPIASARAKHTCGQMIMHGTSMSAPLVSGLVARYRSASPTLSAAALRAILAASGTKPTSRVSFLRKLGNRQHRLTPTVETYQPSPFHYGHGIVHARALDDMHVIDGRDIAPGEILVFETTTGDSKLNVVLAWTDPPSSPNARRMLVNDLDLDVLIGGRQRVYGNHHVNHLKGPDLVNNMEKVWDIPAHTNVQIFVRGARLVAAQTFALVALSQAEDDVAPVIEERMYSAACSGDMPAEPCTLPLGGGTKACDPDAHVWSSSCTLEYCKNDYVFTGGECTEGDAFMCFGYATSGTRCHIENGEGFWCTVLGQCAVSRCTYGFVPRATSCQCDRTINEHCVASASDPEETDESHKEKEVVHDGDNENSITFIVLIIGAIIIVVCVVIYEGASHKFSPSSFHDRAVQDDLLRQYKQPLLHHRRKTTKAEAPSSRKRRFPRLMTRTKM